MTKVEAVVTRERVETVIDAVETETGHVGVTVVEDSIAPAVVAAITDAARSGHESGDGIVWTTSIENVRHNRTGLALGEVEVA